MIEEEFGQEANRLTYTRFYIDNSTRRASQAPNKIIEWAKLQLPTGSCLHTVNGLETLTAPNEGLPNIDYPLLKNEKNPIFLKINLYPSDETSKPFGVDETYSYRPSRVSSAVSTFYNTHKKFKRILSDRTIGKMPGILNWIDYSPLCEMKVSGVLHNYRKFDIIARTVLNTISKIGNNTHHFILIPQLNHVYSRAVLQRTFSDLSTSTLNAFNHDPSIYFVLQILGYVYGKTHDLSVKPYAEDIRLKGEDDDLISHLKSTSLLERLDDDLYPAINFVFQRGDRAVVYNLEDIRKFSEKPAFYTALYRHLMNLRLSESEVPENIDPDSDEFDTFVSDISDTKAENRVQDIPESSSEEEVITPVKSKKIVNIDSKVVKTPLNPEKSSRAPLISIQKPSETAQFENIIRKESERHIKISTDEDSVKLSKHEELIENHFNTELSGVSLKSLISQDIPIETDPHNLDFIDSTPEDSYKKSSIIAIDKVYDKHFYKKDLAKVLGSLAKHGFYITKIDETHLNSEMDRTITYKVNLTDVNGKAHHVKFTVPHIDNDGNVKLGGVNYRLIRQATNLPICKISVNRVNLSSFYNKLIVERVQSKRNSFENFLYKLIVELKNEDVVDATLGKSQVPSRPVPYDYSSLGNKFTQISFNGYYLNFNNDRSNLSEDNLKSIDKLEDQYGVFLGYHKSGSILFWDMANVIHEIRDNKQISSWKSFRQMLFDITKSDIILIPVVSEWTQAQILNQVIPIVFILGYQHGLKKLFEMINLDYTFYENGTPFEIDMDDIVVEFEDGSLVFNRYPLQRSLIASGLSWVPLKQFSFREMNVPQTYVKALSVKGITVGVFKGIKGFVDFFVDPITEEILEKMGEPTTFSGLLLKSNIMLSDYQTVEPSSVSMQRFRLYERFNGMIYNEIYRTLANHRNNTTTRKGFSINPEAVYQSIIQDATMSINDTINPVHEVKQRTNFTYTGSGGRDSDSFVLRDRVYPKDGVGVISDAVPDSGKVGITAYLSASPRIDNVRGIPIPYKEGDELEPPQILSIGSMVMPGGTTDDGKRNSYLSIQISHYVPNHEEGETLSVRTGYDEVLPHLCSDIFAIAANDSGIVEKIDERMKVVTVRYEDKPIKTIKSLRLPYPDSVIDKSREEKSYVSFLIPDTKVSDYPMGGIFSLTTKSNGKVVDRLICNKVEDIPDKEVARKYNELLKELLNKKYKSLYYIRLEVIGKFEKGNVKTYAFKDIYSPISGSHLLQKREINVKVGEKVNRGDILVYNSGFFVPSPFSKQVTFKHGVIGTIALVERSTNHEDACEITREFSERLKMTPCHKREIITKKDAAILAMVEVGDFVETTDPLCIISDEYLVQTHGVLTSENLDIMAKLNRQTPAADYNGHIREIRFLYACDRSELSESLRKILSVYEKKIRQEYKALGTSEEDLIENPGYVKPGTKYLGIDFAEDTVIIEFMIEEELGTESGDKLVVGNANKSIVSYVSENPHYTEDGQTVDMLFSTTSITNRIVKSPFSIGMGETVMEKLKEKAISMYFD